MIIYKNLDGRLRVDVNELNGNNNYLHAGKDNPSLYEVQGQVQSELI